MEIVQVNSIKAWLLAARPKTLAGAATPVLRMPFGSLGWLTCWIRLEIGCRRPESGLVSSSANVKGVMPRIKKMPVSIPTKASKINTITQFPPFQYPVLHRHQRYAPADGAAYRFPKAAFAGWLRSWIPFETRHAPLPCHFR